MGCGNSSAISSKDPHQRKSDTSGRVHITPLKRIKSNQPQSRQIVPTSQTSINQPDMRYKLVVFDKNTKSRKERLMRKTDRSTKTQLPLVSRNVKMRWRLYKRNIKNLKSLMNHRSLNLMNRALNMVHPKKRWEKTSLLDQESKSW